VTNFPYTLPQDELIKIFARSCNKHIAQILQIQKHKIFKEALSQAKLIEKVKTQSCDIKLHKKNNNNDQKHNDSGNNNQVYQNPYNNQVSYNVNQIQPIMATQPPSQPRVRE